MERGKREREHILENKLWRVVVNVFVTIGIAVLYYIGFSFFFDTPAEYHMKSSTAVLRQQYDCLLTHRLWMILYPVRIVL